MRWKLEIDQMNETRKNMTDQIMKRTELQIKLTKPVIMLALQDCHEGLIGIAAGRYEKKMLKPVIIGSISDGTIKCSMRAPKGFDCMKLLGGFDKLTACGGHARAAGFSLKESDWPEFEKYCQDTVRNLDWQPVPDLHLAISEEECTFENIDSLDLLRPFGEEFKMPVFVIENPQIVSTFDLREGKHRKFQLAKGLEVLNFNQSSEDYQAKPETIASFGGRLQTQIFMGSRKCSLYADEITYRAL
jgi:single-stranded-DNA-specific exonuclease